jgi:TonB family protein
MRVAIAALALGLLAATGARAADLTDPVWAQAPDQSDWAKAYPAAAAAAGVSGSVSLRCTASATGSLDGCRVAQESPQAAGFGAAALSLASQMQLRTTDAQGQSIAGRSLVVPVKFTPGVLHPGAVVSNPDWMRKPTQAEASSYFPAGAQGEAGHALIVCAVTTRGLLDRCEVASESPPGHGFGAASLALSQLFLMRPMTVDGQPVAGGQVQIPISFAGGSIQPTSSITVLRAAPWMATPTAADMAAAFPHDAIGHVASAHVVLRCALRRDGTLADCDVTQDTGPGSFGHAAITLSHAFHAYVGPNDHIRDLYVDLPFDFRDPSKPQPPLDIYDPLWLTKVDPSVAVKLFPPEAVAAGRRDGRAIVVCAVAHDGALTDCSVSSETPTGLGFGAAALKIASVMKMNPWTAQGMPVDGAHIALPINLVLPPDAPSPPASPAH